MTVQHGVKSPIRHRYELAARRIPVHAADVLDVGGYENRAEFVRRHSPQVVYHSVNIGPAWYGKDAVPGTLYDGTALPFQDQSFDCVISVDTLEHVKYERRPSLIDEMIRVARMRAIIVTPFAPRGQRTPEADFVALCDSFDISPMPSLLEHLSNGLPALVDLIECAESRNGNITPATPRGIYWSTQFAMLWNTIAAPGEGRLSAEILERGEEYLHSCLDERLTFEDAYRAVLVFDK